MGLELGQYLRECRELKGLTQANVAKTLNYTNSQFISNVERGLARPPMYAAKQWCEAIGAKENLVIKKWITEVTEEIKESFR